MIEHQFLKILVVCRMKRHTQKLATKASDPVVHKIKYGHSMIYRLLWGNVRLGQIDCDRTNTFISCFHFPESYGLQGDVSGSNRLLPRISDDVNHGFDAIRSSLLPDVQLGVKSAIYLVKIVVIFNVSIKALSELLVSWYAICSELLVRHSIHDFKISLLFSLATSFLRHGCDVSLLVQQLLTELLRSL